MQLLAPERGALDEFCAWLRRRFGERVVRLMLFGSRARGEGSEDSDVDVLVVVDALTDAEAREIAHQAGDALTGHDVLLVPLVVSRARYQEWRDRERRIALDIDRDGIAL